MRLGLVLFDDAESNEGYYSKLDLVFKQFMCTGTHGDFNSHLKLTRKNGVLYSPPKLKSIKNNINPLKSRGKDEEICLSCSFGFAYSECQRL